MERRTHIRNRKDGGSALTEFVIVAPLFVLLMFWSQWFTDLGTARLKLEEAARFASWEMTAQRPIATVANEVRDRFKDMRSVTDREYPQPYGMKAFKDDVTFAATIQDKIDAPFDRGEVARGNTSGLLGQIMAVVTKLLNKAAKAILSLYNFETTGIAQADVSMTVNNAWIPQDGGWLYKAFFKPGPGDRPYNTITMRAKSAPILVNTWKAWPGKYLPSNGGAPKGASLAQLNDVATSPYMTYPQSVPDGPASAPEKVLSYRLQRIAFLPKIPIVGSVLRGFSRILGILRLPKIDNVDTFDQKTGGIEGPVIMLPGVRQTRSWQPGNNLPMARIGLKYTNQTNVRTQDVDGAQTPYDTDHYRFTTPTFTTSRWWLEGPGKGVGMGYQSGRKATGVENNPNSNAYVKMYNCRDAWYMGSKKAELKRWKNSAWTQTAFQGCN